MKLLPQTIATVARRKMSARAIDNMNSFLDALNSYGAKAGLDVPHRLAIYLANVMHENSEFFYDTEVWGPTAAQKRYEDRADLGHSKAVDGEAFLFRGRTGIQITGRHNYRKFTAWVRRFINPNAPDFEKEPDLVLTDPYEGLGPVWYWDAGNPDNKSLNRYADRGDHEMVRRRINGGLNGFVDVLALYTRIALVFLGYGPTEVRKFQAAAKAKGAYKGEVDGDPGPQTRAALHTALAALSGAVDTKPAPVTAEVPVEGAEKVAVQRTGGALALVSPFLAWLGSLFVGLNQTGVFILLGIGLVGVVILLWRGEVIAARAKAVLKSFGAET